MQRVWLCIFSGRPFEDTLKTHSGEEPNKCNQFSRHCSENPPCTVLWTLHALRWRIASLCCRNPSIFLSTRLMVAFPDLPCNRAPIFVRFAFRRKLKFSLQTWSPLVFGSSINHGRYKLANFGWEAAGGWESWYLVVLSDTGFNATSLLCCLWEIVQ